MALTQVTIFGASGFIGRHVVKRLASRGARIVAAVRRPQRANFLRPMGDVGQIEPVQANIRDDASAARAIEGADAVVNLVGILYETGRQRFQTIQAEGAGRIARLAREAGVARLVHLSAIGADPSSTSAYARSKAAGEEAVRAAFSDAVILRPSIVFGPEDDFFNRFAAIARLSPVLPLIGGGRTRFQPVYAGDVADAVLAALEREDAGGRTYELGGPHIYSFEDILRYILEVTGRRRLLLPLPFPLARLAGRILGLLPNPLLTADQVRLLEHDNVVSEGAPGFADLGITPDSIEANVPAYLYRFRRSGQFGRTLSA